MTYDFLKQEFGDRLKTVAELSLTYVLKLSMLDEDDFVNIFKVVLKNFKTKADRKQQFSCNREDLYSTFIFQNLYIYIDQTDCFDAAIKNGNLATQLKKLLSANDAKFKKNYRNNVLAEKHEILCEFVELVDSKMKKLLNSTLF